MPKIKPITARHFSGSTEYKKLDIKVLFLAWHLIKGGIRGADKLSELVGQKITDPDGIEEVCDRLIYGPLSPEKPVRCGGCGFKLVDLPCATCSQLVNNSGLRLC